DDHEAATRTKGTKYAGIDCRRIRQVMVNDATEERIAAGVGEVCPGDCPLDQRDVQEPLCFCGSLNIGKKKGIELGRIHMTGGADPARQGYRERPVTCAQICDTRPGFYVEPGGETLYLSSRRAMNKRQIRQTGGCESAKTCQRQQSKNDPPFQSRR